MGIEDKMDVEQTSWVSRILWLVHGTHIIKKFWMPLALLLIIVAIFFSVFRALTPWATQYKGEVEQHLSTLLGQPVAIQSMETSWYWFEPVLRLNQVSVSDKTDKTIQLNKLLVGINLLSSLWHWHIEPGILYIDDVHLTLHQEKEGTWTVDGLSQKKPIKALRLEDYAPVLTWLLAQQKIIIKNISARIHLNDGTLLPLHDISLTALNNNGRYRLKGEVKLAQEHPTELTILADMKLNPYALNKASGEAYLSLQHFNAAKWRKFIPENAYKLVDGQGNFEVWMDINKGNIAGVQTKFNIHDLAWMNHGSKRFIESLKANLAWHATANGWQLTGDDVHLRLDGMTWPRNNFLVDYEANPQKYHVYVKEILIESLLNFGIEWPKEMQELLAMHPIGRLHDTQLYMTDAHMDSLLTGFTELGWKARGSMPGVLHLSGVFQWQPLEGHLALDSKGVNISFLSKPTLIFDEVNAGLDWNTIQQAYQVHLNHMLLMRPDFSLSGSGQYQQPQDLSLAAMQLNLHFAATDAVSWLAMIPSAHLKPKLDDWLKQDITRIDKVSGDFTFDGLLADFPFDKKPGVFFINSHLQGVDLIFNSKWPEAQGIDADLQVDKRSLNADISKAWFRKIPLSTANVRVDDLGLDKETLLVHGKAIAYSPAVMDYIFNSPLAHSLKKLKALDIEGPLDLDLNIEVPLYPENDDVLVEGSLGFKDNLITYEHAVHPVQFEHMTGQLNFNEHGASISYFDARFFEEPVHISIHSTGQAPSSTLFELSMNTSMEHLKQQLDAPLLGFMQGNVALKAQLALTDKPDAVDTLTIKTSLQGVDVFLPQPLAKSKDENIPLSVTMRLNDEQGVNLAFNYQGRLSGDFYFSEGKSGLTFRHGDLHIGQGQAKWNNWKGLGVTGSLATLNLDVWRKFLAQAQDNSHSSVGLLPLQFIDMKIGTLHAWDRDYSNITFYANKLDKQGDLWSFKVDEANIAGNVQYQRSTNTWSGHLTRLYFDKLLGLDDPSKKHENIMRPLDIPNLNLSIDTVQWKNIDIGKVNFKSISSAKNWHIEQCSINSPAYQIEILGDWLKDSKNKVNLTKMQANVKLMQFEESLKRWNLTPAVEAKEGDFQFKGEWPGSISAFSLSKIHGNLFLRLKDGRITHLSPETEEKLGLGKLLSILSLQTIPRRLKLDFSDLAHSGYSFDVFQGNFSLNKGILNTMDSYLDGPVAYASMKGDLDLIKQRYNLDLHISPHITASLPIVATIAGGPIAGPIAGLATWAASKIIDQGMQQVSGYSYKVSGPWLTPDVQQVSIFKKNQVKK